MPEMFFYCFQLEIFIFFKNKFKNVKKNIFKIKSGGK